MCYTLTFLARSLHLILFSSRWNRPVLLFRNPWKVNRCCYMSELESLYLTSMCILRLTECVSLVMLLCYFYRWHSLLLTRNIWLWSLGRCLLLWICNRDLLLCNIVYFWNFIRVIYLASYRGTIVCCRLLLEGTVKSQNNLTSSNYVSTMRTIMWEIHEKRFIYTKISTDFS